jgi:hypothetical protein
VVVSPRPAGRAAATTGPRQIGDYWDDMVRWRFGHPRGVRLPSGDIFVTYYAGDARTTSVRWARLTI